MHFFHDEDTEISLRRHDLRTTKAKILRRLERILLGGFLGVLCVLAVNAGLQIYRQDAKDAKETPSNIIWLRPGRAVLIRGIRGQ